MLPEDPDKLSYSASEWRYKPDVWERVKSLVEEEMKRAIEVKQSLNFHLSFLVLRILPESMTNYQTAPDWVKLLMGGKVGSETWPEAPLPVAFRNDKKLMAYLSRKMDAPKPPVVEAESFGSVLRKNLFAVAGTLGFGPATEHGEILRKKAMGQEVSESEERMLGLLKTQFKKLLPTASAGLKTFLKEKGLQAIEQLGAGEEEPEAEEQGSEEEETSSGESEVSPEEDRIHRDACTCDGCRSLGDVEEYGFDVTMVNQDHGVLSGYAVDQFEAAAGTLPMSEIVAAVGNKLSKRLGRRVTGVVRKRHPVTRRTMATVLPIPAPIGKVATLSLPPGLGSSATAPVVSSGLVVPPGAKALRALRGIGPASAPTVLGDMDGMEEAINSGYLLGHTMPERIRRDEGDGTYFEPLSAAAIFPYDPGSPGYVKYPGLATVTQGVKTPPLTTIEVHVEPSGDDHPRFGEAVTEQFALDTIKYWKKFKKLLKKAKKFLPTSMLGKIPIVGGLLKKIPIVGSFLGGSKGGGSATENVIGAAASLIPGLGPIAGMAAPLIGRFFKKKKKRRAAPPPSAFEGQPPPNALPTFSTEQGSLPGVSALQPTSGPIPAPFYPSQAMGTLGGVEGYGYTGGGQMVGYQPSEYPSFPEEYEEVGGEEEEEEPGP